MVSAQITAWSIGFNLYAWIRLNLPVRSRIVQFGSGHIDSILLIDYDLVSIEHNEKWLKSHCVYAPIVNGWYDVDKLSKVDLSKSDLYLIDGPTGNIGRDGILDNLNLFDTSKPFIVDDTNRPDEKALAISIGKRMGRSPIFYNDQNNKEFAII